MRDELGKLFIGPWEGSHHRRQAGARWVGARVGPAASWVSAQPCHLCDSIGSTSSCLPTKKKGFWDLLTFSESSLSLPSQTLVSLFYFSQDS